MDLRQTSAPVRCAYCHGELRVAAATCSLCGTQLHAECRAVLNECPTLGCASPLPQAKKRRLRPARLIAAFAGGLLLGVVFLLAYSGEQVSPEPEPERVTAPAPPEPDPIALVVPKAPPPVEPVTAASAPSEAMARGLRYLAGQQDEMTGAYVAGVGRKNGRAYLASVQKHVGVTALVGLAFLSEGSTPQRGDYQEQIRGCLRFVELSCRRNGFISNAGSRTYSHAFTTLFLAQAYAADPSPRVRDVLKRASAFLVAAQNKQGGWRYMPGSKDSDLSISVVCLTALRLAEQVGIRVGDSVIDAAVLYVKRSYIRESDSSPESVGGFWYQVFETFPFRPSRTSYALTATGVSALCDAGLQDSVEVRGGLRFLRDPSRRPPASDMNSSLDYFFGHYFAARAFYRAGDGDEPLWSTYYTRLRDDLVAGQRDDGAWRDLIGPNYATAMACVVLQTPRCYGATGDGQTAGEWLWQIDSEPVLAARALGRIGPAASVALPALLELARTHADEATREAAAQAVQAIRGD